MAFTASKTLRGSNYDMEIIKDEITTALEDKFECEIKDNNNELEVTLVSRSASKIIKTQGKFRLSNHGERSKITFSGNNKMTARAYIGMALSIPLFLAGGIGLILMFLQFFMMNKAAKQNEKEVNEVLNEVSMLLVTTAVN